MADQILVTGSAGAQFAVDPDLPWVTAQLKTGQLTPVQGSAGAVETGGTSAGEDSETQAPAEAPERPSNTASKSDWVDYTVSTTDLSETEADDLTKRELIDLADNQ